MVGNFPSIPYVSHTLSRVLGLATREGVIISFNVMCDATKSKINQLKGRWNMRQIKFKFRNQICAQKLYYILCSVKSFPTDAHALK